MDIRLGGIIYNSLVNGPGMRTVLFMQGCEHKCPGCHNPSSWDMSGGCLFDIDNLINELTSDPLLDGVTISGGEPFMQIEELFYLLKELKVHDINVWVYTGFKYETLKETLPNIFKYIDVLVDGKFIKDLYNKDLNYRGSSNQRVIDVRHSNIWEVTVIEDDCSSIHRT